MSGLRALKGADRSAGRTLAALAAEGLVDVHLAILEKHETGSAAEEYGGYGGYGWGSKRRRCWYDDDEEDEEEDEEEEAGRSGGYTMEEASMPFHGKARCGVQHAMHCTVCTVVCRGRAAALASASSRRLHFIICLAVAGA